MGHQEPMTGAGVGGGGGRLPSRLQPPGLGTGASSVSKSEPPTCTWGGRVAHTEPFVARGECAGPGLFWRSPRPCPPATTPPRGSPPFFSSRPTLPHSPQLPEEGRALGRRPGLRQKGDLRSCWLQTPDDSEDGSWGGEGPGAGSRG